MISPSYIFVIFYAILGAFITKYFKSRNWKAISALVIAGLAFGAIFLYRYGFEWK